MTFSKSVILRGSFCRQNRRDTRYLRSGGGDSEERQNRPLKSFHCFFPLKAHGLPGNWEIIVPVWLAVFGHEGPYCSKQNTGIHLPWTWLVSNITEFPPANAPMIRIIFSRDGLYPNPQFGPQGDAFRLSWGLAGSLAGTLELPLLVRSFAFSFCLS